MPKDLNKLRNKLLDIEPFNPHYQRRFEEATQLVRNPQLTRNQRRYYICLFWGTILCALSVVSEVVLFRHEPLTVVVLLIGLALLLTATIMIRYFLRRNAEDFNLQQRLGKILPGLPLAVTMGMLIYSSENPSIQHFVWCALAGLFFVLTSFINLYNRIILAERTTREQLLRIEYRLATLSPAPPSSS